MTTSGNPISAGSPLEHDRDARLGSDPLRGELVAALPERLGRRPDPGHAGGLDRLGKVRALGEEAVARVDRIGARLPCGSDVLLGVEVAGDLDRLVGRARVQGAAVVGGGHGDGRDPELATRAKDAQRDLAAVRHQELPDRHRV